MVSVHSGTIAWQLAVCSEDVPDAYQLRLGTASGIYTYCSCYAATVTGVALRDLLSTPGPYVAKVVGSLATVPIYCSTEIAFTLTGRAVSVR